MYIVFLGKGDGPAPRKAATDVAQSVGQDRHLRGVAAEVFGKNAASNDYTLTDRTAGGVKYPDQKSFPTRVAAVDTMFAIAPPDTHWMGSKTPGKVDPGDMQALVGALGPRDTGTLARKLGEAGHGDQADPADPAGIIGLQRGLEALNGGPPSEATSAFVQNSFMQVNANDYSGDAGMAPAMAQGLAREWYPDNPRVAANERDRMNGILGSGTGQALLGGPKGSKVPPAMRVNALAIIRMNPGITADTLNATSDPWANPAIVAPMAQQFAQPYLTRSKTPDAPQTLAKTDLENTIGLAMRIQPTVPADMTAKQAADKLGHGDANFFQNGKAGEIVGKVAKKIREFGDPAQVTVLPITFSSEEYGPVEMSLFRVRDGGGKDHFIDTEGRVYSDINDFRNNNKLPPGYLSVPKGGHLTAGPDGHVEEEGGSTDSFGKKAGRVIDKVALGAGVVAGVAVIIGTDGLAAPLVGAAAAGWGAARQGGALYDRAQHGQSIDPLRDEQARGLWLGLGANALGVGAFGAAGRVASLARAGEALAPLEASVMGTVNVGANVTNLAALGNEGVTLARHWDEMTDDEKAVAALQLGFWGLTTAVGARNSGGPGEMFNPVKARESLMTKYGQSTKPPGPPPSDPPPKPPNEPVKTGGTLSATHQGEPTTGQGHPQPPKPEPSRPEQPNPEHGGSEGAPSKTQSTPSTEALKAARVKQELEAELTKRGLASDPMFAALDPQTMGKVNTALKGDPLTKAGPGQAAAQDWARAGAGGNAREFANRYEYARAQFTQARKAATKGSAGKPNARTEADKAASAQMTPDHLKQQLDADINNSRRLGPAENLPPIAESKSAHDVATDVKSLKRIGFESETAEAYHARKHGEELPPLSQFTDNAIKNYAEASSDTIHRGNIAEATRMPNGSIRCIIRKTYGSKPGSMMEAIIYVRPDGKVTLASYGAAKAKL